MTRARIGPVVVAVLVATAMAMAGCSSSSSGGNPATSSSALPTSATSVDHATVDAALSDVLAGLRTLHSVPSGSGPTGETSGLRTAAADLKKGADTLTPAPAGVPDAAAGPVSSGLLEVSGLMTQTADCLVGAGGNQGATASCANPLRQADKATGQLARDLITLAAYGSKTPTDFEQDLVTALHG